jgi:hypothetical protein
MHMVMVFAAATELDFMQSPISAVRWRQVETHLMLMSTQPLANVHTPLLGQIYSQMTLRMDGEILTTEDMMHP